MTASLLIAAALAGAAYVITPGPAFLALLGIGAGQGRRAGLLFLSGHLLGDTAWASLSLVAIIGSASLGTLVFDILGLVCGAYLLLLGWRALRAMRRSDGGLSSAAEKPLRRGLAFGLTNPKAYPVSVAMFTALLASHAAELDWSSLPPLLAAAFLGFLGADAVLLWVIGAAPVRRLYRRHELWITRLSGAIFIGFGLQALWHAAPGLLARRA
ncbi:MAG TPA: LysE family translocator [Ferrovibrio sp.]|jgi:threonine/homoserine/homoserine lactone efflux protein|uniref:LysE family translocator n=1 Tax=Ferrovibrio sp. TaxID=1917215 RepID=UPI002ED2DE5F